MQLKRYSFFCLLFCASLRPFDTVHFYRAPLLLREPWLERPWISGFFISGAHGDTKKSKNNCGTTVPLFDIYGTSDIQAAAQGIPASENNILFDLASLPTNNNFAHLSIAGKFHATEVVFEWYQNFVHGLFFHAHLPIRRLKIDTATFIDLSPTTGSGPLQSNATWQTFLANKDQILGQFGLFRHGYTKQGVGDLGIALGWTINCEQTKRLDFIDATLQIGVTAPTSKHATVHHLLNIPLGYNGHTSFFIQADAATGIYDWLTFGITATGMVFTNHTEIQRVKTNSQQQGIILFNQQPVHVHKGPIAIAGALLKGDHFLRGLSFNLAYQFNYQGKDTWKLCSTGQCYPFDDQRLSSWNMHTINLGLDYDFANRNHPCAPRIGFIYNTPITGDRIFLTPLIGGELSFIISSRW